MPVDDHVREQSPVLVALFGVELQRDALAGELRLGEVARDMTEALDRLARIHDLRRVDTEQPDLLDRAAVEARDHGVAVDDADHGCGETRRDVTAREPSPPDAPEQGGHDNREHRQATSHGPGAGHARNVAGHGTRHLRDN